MLVVNQRLAIPLREFEFTFARSGGPGGQNVNKVNSKAILRWPVRSTGSLPDDVRRRFLRKYSRRISGEGDLIVTSQRFRDRGRNVADCLYKLREMLESVALAPKRRKPTKPTRGSQERRLRNKRNKAEAKKRRRRPDFDE